MYTFIFVSSTVDSLADRILNKCAPSIRGWLPSLQVQPAEKRTELKEGRHAWLSYAPTGAEPNALITQHMDEQFAVIVFGDLVRCLPQNTASFVLKKWRTGGPLSVRSLEGCFSAVIVDRVLDKVFLVSDALGQRTLRYYADDETLVVSPQRPIIFDDAGCAHEVYVWPE